MTKLFHAQVVCRFKFACPLKWFQLKEQGGDPMIRHCDQCQEPVYRCDDYTALQEHVAAGHCVAINLHGDMRVATMGIIPLEEIEVR